MGNYGNTNNHRRTGFLPLPTFIINVSCIVGCRLRVLYQTFWWVPWRAEDWKGENMSLQFSVSRLLPGHFHLALSDTAPAWDDPQKCSPLHFLLHAPLSPRAMLLAKRTQLEIMHTKFDVSNLEAQIEEIQLCSSRRTYFLPVHISLSAAAAERCPKERKQLRPKLSQVIRCDR